MQSDKQNPEWLSLVYFNSPRASDVCFEVICACHLLTQTYTVALMFLSVKESILVPQGPSPATHHHSSRQYTKSKAVMLCLSDQAGPVLE